MKKDITELHKSFMRDAQYASKRSPSTLKAYQGSFNVLMKLVPGLNLDRLTHDTMSAFFEMLQTRQRTNGKYTKTGVKASTIETYFSKLGPFFTWLEKNEHIKKNPLTNITRPNVNYDDMQFLTHEQVMQILVYINFNMKWANNFIKKRNDLIIYLCLTCGLRKNEMRSISVNDIDLKNGIIKVQAQTSKSKRQRLVGINSVLLPRLIDYLNERKTAKIQTHYLITSNSGDRQLSDGGLKHLIERIRKESGVKFHLHQFRHTFSINFLLQQNKDIFTLKQILGHTDIRMTDKYTKCLPTSVLRSSVECITPDNLF